MSTTYQLNSYDNFCVNTDCKEKDLLISQLHAHIFELEHQEKDYELLNQKFRQLQNEYSLLNESKLRLEYQLKQKDDAYNKRICDLRGENENLQIGFNEKMSVNKKLYCDNDRLGKDLDMKNAEALELNAKINELSEQLNTNITDKNDLEKVVQNLNDCKKDQNIQINKLVEDNKKLSQICQEQERNIQCCDQERQNISMKINESNNNINELNRKLTCHKNNLDKLQNDLDNANTLNCKLQNTKQDYERQLQNLRNDNERLKNNLMNEKNLRNEDEKRNTDLGNVINDRERKIAQLNREVDEIKMTQQSVSNSNDAYQIDNQNLKNHINVLTSQNKKLICELENVLAQDEDMKKKFARKDNVVLLLTNNKNCLDQSVNSLDELINGNRGNNFCQSKNIMSASDSIHFKTSSPKYTYDINN